jgi:alpha-D-xyloside xylohydrolase
VIGGYDVESTDPIRLFVYAGLDGSFTLYEDENVNYKYEEGRFSIIPLSYSEKDHVLTIGKRQGEFPGMLETRTFEIVWISAQRPSGLDFQAKPDATVRYDGTPRSVRMNVNTK